MKKCTLNLGECFASGGETIVVAARSLGVCQLTRLVIPDSVAPHFDVLTIRVRDTCQVNTLETKERAVPATSFAESARDNHLKLDTVRPDALVSLKVRNKTSDTHVFQARLEGVASVASESAVAARDRAPRPWWTLPEVSELVWCEHSNSLSRPDWETVTYAYQRIYEAPMPKAQVTWDPSDYERYHRLPGDVVVYACQGDSEIRRLKPRLATVMDALTRQHDLELLTTKIVARQSALQETAAVVSAKPEETPAWLAAQLRACDEEVYELALQVTGETNVADK